MTEKWNSYTDPIKKISVRPEIKVHISSSQIHLFGVSTINSWGVVFLTSFYVYVGNFCIPLCTAKAFVFTIKWVDAIYVGLQL